MVQYYHACILDKMHACLSRRELREHSKRKNSKHRNTEFQNLEISKQESPNIEILKRKQVETYSNIEISLNIQTKKLKHRDVKTFFQGFPR